MKRNCYGYKIVGEPIVERRDFLNDNEEITWGKINRFATKEGFDSRYEIISNYILKPGTKLVRYGPLEGRNSSDIGTPYEDVSLPYYVSTVEYHELIVCKDINVMVIVKKGIVAADFGRRGMGVQYTHEESIKTSIEKGKIKEVKTWLIPALIKNLIWRH